MDDKREDRRILLRSYSSIWKIEKRLEHLNGIRLNSIPLEHALYIMGCFLVGGLLLLLIPPLRRIPLVIKLALPYGIASFLKKVKLDGKSPIKYFACVIEFLVGPRVFVRFRELKEQKEIQFSDLIPYRRVKKVWKEGSCVNSEI